MAKLPAFQFYPGDWLKDPNLRRCSKAAKGVWIDMMCLMFECEDRGVFASGGVPWDRNEIAGAIGGDRAENLACIEELLLKGVASLTKLGAISNRRMVRDQEKRADNRGRQHAFRNSHKTNKNSNADITRLSHASSSSSSTTKQKTKTPPHPPPGGVGFSLPDWVPKDAWEAWLEMRKKKRASPTLRAMHLAVERLVTLKASGSEPREVLDQSTFRGWTGLFEVRQSPLGTGYANPGKENRHESRNDRIEREALALLDDQTPENDG